ncbi:MAG: MTH1187 family thiamine-binding protein [Candidatus Thiodiazotropha sp. (ex Semelilucina semeliformis)]|nr:MTH1187 family thiamine-binding protein [Candidatus Thiodiazotropha sp. (ex Semelilucina semeliformis)]
MSVLLEFSIFPTDQGESVSAPVSQVIKLIRDSGIDYQLTPMGTIIETENIEQALDLVKASSKRLQQLGAQRVYSSIKLDIRQGEMGRLTGKIRSVKDRIGEIST